MNVTPMQLQSVAKDIWVVSKDHRFIGVNLGARMTIIRLENGELILYSPVTMTDEIKKRVADLGRVAHIVAPNLFHHLYATAWADAYPDATVYGAAGLQKKSPKLRLTARFSNETMAPWSGQVGHHTVKGMPALAETVLFHRSSRTLICADLIFHISEPKGLWTSVYLKMAGVSKRAGVSRLVKIATKDKGAAGESVRTILSWDFDRIIMAHGEILQQDGKAILRDSYRWLTRLLPSQVGF